jgi:uncharacterized membrane protein
MALLNNPAVAEEIVRGLAGTAGLLLTIPLTALFGVALQPEMKSPEKPV